jgi:hypothetical protein
MAAFDPVQGSKALIFVDEFNLSSQSSGAQIDITVDTIDFSVMASPAKNYLPIKSSPAITHNGYFTGVDEVLMNGIEQIMFDRLGTSAPVMVSLVLDEIVYTMYGTYGQQLTIDAPVDGLITVEGNWAPGEALGRGLKVALDRITAATPSTPVDLGAASKFASVVIHVNGFADLSAGADTVTITIETSPTQGGSYTAWLSKVFKKPGVSVAQGALNPGRWARVKVALTAGVPGPIDVLASVI